MNMISTGSFLNETGASNKQNELVKKLTSAWEKKNSKTARAGGVSLMALSLAACGDEDTTPFSQADIDAATAPLTAAVAAAEAAQAAAEEDAAAAAVAQAAAEEAAAAALVAQTAAEAEAAAALVAQAAAEADAAAALVAQAAAEAAQAAAETALAAAQADLTAKTAEYDALVATNATLQASYDALVAPKSLSFVSTSAETLNGGAGDDTFTAGGSNYGSGDKIRDTSSDDNDTANYTLTAGDTPDITGVENVNVTINSVGTATLTASSMDGVETLTITRGDVVVGGSTITGDKTIDINALNASNVASVTVGGVATTVALDQTVKAGVTLNADVATGSVSVIGAGTINAAGAGAGDTVTVTAGGNDAGELFEGVGAVENAKAVTVNTGAENVVIANDGAATADAFTGVITVTGAATKDVSIAAASGGGSVNVLGETGTVGTNGVKVAGVDASGFSVTTSYVGTSTAAGAISVEGTSTANQTDVATISAAGVQNVNLNLIETVNLSGNGQAATYDIAATSDVTTYAASGDHAVSLRGDLTEFDGATITGVSALDIDGGTAATIDLGKMDATTSVDLGINNAGNAITLQSGTSVTVTSDQTTDLEFSFKTGSTAFDMSIVAGDDNGASTAVGTIDVTTLKVNGSATVAGTVNLDASIANFNAATSTVLGAKQNLVITGDEDVTLGAVTADSVNAAASTGIITLEAAANVDVVTTGAGADILSLTDATVAHTVDAGAGNDQVTITATKAGALIVGGAGNDLIIANETANAYVVNGGAGNDTVRIADINATLVGGDGDDTLDVNTTLDLSDTSVTTNGLLAISGFETIDMEATGQQVLTMRANTFAGNNTFVLDVDDATDTLTVNAAATGSTIDASGVTLASGDTAAIINLNGGAGNDVITGGVVGENFVQTRGSDSIEGGSTGTDTITLIANGATVGSTGTTATGSIINLGSTAVSASAVVASISQHLSGGLTEVAAGKAGYVFAASSALNSADLDTVSGIENITGGSGADYIVGTAGNNAINGQAGADYIDGGDGDDTITIDTAAEGNSDKMHGGLGTDTLAIGANTTVSSTDADITGIENIAISGATTVVLTGQSDAFAISVTDTVTALTTGSGSDTITLTAGTAANTINISDGSGSDVITGFDTTEDKLSFDGLTDVTATTGTALAANAAATTFTDAAVYVAASGVGSPGTELEFAL